MIDKIEEHELYLLGLEFEHLFKDHTQIFLIKFIFKLIPSKFIQTTLKSIDLDRFKETEILENYV